MSASWPSKGRNQTGENRKSEWLIEHKEQECERQNSAILESAYLLKVDQYEWMVRFKQKSLKRVKLKHT